MDYKGLYRVIEDYLGGYIHVHGFEGPEACHTRCRF